MRRVVVVLAAVAALAGVALPAGAVAPDAQGWWWQAQQSVSGGANEVTPRALPPPPFVPADGLYVASDASGPQAMSALLFNFDPAASAGTLTLQVADAIGTPIVGACIVRRVWAAEQGGTWARKPPEDCEAGAVRGVVSQDQTKVTFNVGRLAEAGQLNIGIVAGVDDTGANPTFHLAIAKPGADALALAAPTGGAPSEGEAVPVGNTPQGGSAGSSAVDGGSPSLLTSGSDAGGLTPLPPPDSFSGGDDDGFVPAAPVNESALRVNEGTASGGISNSQLVAALAFIGLVLAAIWMRLEGLMRQNAAAGSAEGGVGRLVRGRSGAPPKI